jgi:hypothetical protein
MNLLRVLFVSLLLWTVLAACVYGWQFSVFKSTVNGDWLILGDVQAKECRDGGGCEVFSERELQALRHRFQTQKGTEI